jgi:tRNA-splicing ligase RtcB
MSFVFPHLSLMPDAHLGKGSTVGSVVPTKGAIMPACVGVDIGCGMMALKTTHDVDSIQGMDKKALRESIESQIPLSAGKYNHKVKDDAKWYISLLEDRAAAIGFEPDLLDKNWKLQLGSLGSGNHFIEITKDERRNIWLFLHSGSRGIGNKIAMKHIKIAQAYVDAAGVSLADRDLAYLVEGTPEFQQYIEQMNWAQDFAQFNREVMMKRVEDAFAFHAGDFGILAEINCHHNFTQRELHNGQPLWITRKGAISAEAGQMGLIPGSMGTASYVVEGLGNPLSFNSAPHGAGRNFSRATARKTFTKEDLDIKMQGIEWSGSNAFVDEHPGAYKDIDVVMRDAKDLVVIHHTLNQLINIKGD